MCVEWRVRVTGTGGGGGAGGGGDRWGGAGTMFGAVGVAVPQRTASAEDEAVERRPLGRTMAFSRGASAAASLAVVAMLLVAAGASLAAASRRPGRRGPETRPAGRVMQAAGRAGAAAGVAAAAAALNAAAAVNSVAAARATAWGGEPRAGPFDAALNLGLGEASNATRDDCVWRRAPDREHCPDPAVRLLLHTGDVAAPRREVVELSQRDWLRRSGWDPTLESVLLVHGYGGSEDDITLSVLRNSFLRRGGYNVFSVDWGILARLPCYPAAVHNMRLAARCTAHALTRLRDDGLPAERTTCVGHSLGAHLCGLLAHYLTFRMQRIVALDPARPLVRLQNKLGPGDATAVHVLHTNAGHYGESGRVGHVDFCINGGRMQPFCLNNSNPELCSHARAICYLAESIDPSTAREATPCGRRCPGGGQRGAARLSDPLPMGMLTPLHAVGSFCVVNTDEPYCDKDPRCCTKNNAPWTPPGE